MNAINRVWQGVAQWQPAILLLSLPPFFLPCYSKGNVWTLAHTISKLLKQLFPVD